jgi:uncharacterized protein YndB with AHSA1/START domain
MSKSDDKIERAVRTVAASPEQIFQLLSDPSKHALIDGSGTVKGSSDDLPERLEMGSKFGMKMKLGISYRITNTVVEFDEPNQIGWRHMGGHIWRYKLQAVEGGTEVTEEFDWGPAHAGFTYPLLGYPERNRRAVEETLDRLVAHFA